MRIPAKTSLIANRVQWRHALAATFCALIGLIGNGVASAQTDGDETFRSFSNQAMSPEELLRQLNSLPGVNVGTQQNPMLDEGFRDWVQNDLLPNLSDRDRDALTEIAKDVMRQQGQVQPNPDGTLPNNQQRMQSAAEELRRQVESDPSLERRLRETIRNEGGSQALDQFLNRQFEPQGNSQPTGPGTGNPAEPFPGVGQNPGQGQGDPPPRNSDPTQGGRSGNSNRGDPNGSEPIGPGGERPLNPGGLNPQNPNGQNDPRTNLTPFDPSGGPRGSGDPREPNPGGNGAGEPNSSGGPRGNNGSSPGNGGGSIGGPRNSGTPNRNGNGTGRTRPNTPNRPGRGPENPSINNAPPVREPNRTSPSSPSNRQPPRGERSNQMRPPENERFRDRFNRILMDAARESMEERSEGGGNGSGASGNSNRFEEMLNGLAKSVQEKMDNRETRQSFSNGLQRAQRNGGAPPSFGGSNMIPDGLPAQAPTVNSSTITIAIILIIAVVAAVFLTKSLRRRMSSAVSRYASVIAHAKSFRLPNIDSAADLIRAVDRFVFWKYGMGAHWWHGGRVRNQLIESHPQLSTEIGELLSSYEQARYAPNLQLDNQRIHQNANTLKHLVELVRARELSQLKRSDHTEIEEAYVVATRVEAPVTSDGDST